MDINDNKPFAEPASQLDPTMSVLTEARVLALFDHEFALQDLEVTDEEIMLFALSIETEVLKQLSASRCRAQGGITNDSKGLPISAEGKDSEHILVPVVAPVELVCTIEVEIDNQLMASGLSPVQMQRQDGEEVWNAIINHMRASTGKDTDKEATK